MKEGSKNKTTRSAASKNAETSKRRSSNKSNDGKGIQAKSTKTGSQSNKMEK